MQQQIRDEGKVQVQSAEWLSNFSPLVNLREPMFFVPAWICCQCWLAGLEVWCGVLLKYIRHSHMSL